METRILFKGVRLGLLAIGMTSLMGCTVLQAISKNYAAPTAAPPVNPQPAAPQAPVQAPPAAPQASPTPEPTYTALPTYTPLPTYTALPTFTPLPTFTQPPPPPPPPPQPQPVYVYPTAVPPTPSYGECCTLRVYNYGKRTYWIGTVRPYGGNFIRRGMYVEFYPHRVAWMRIWFCRYTWQNNEVWDELEPWYGDNLYDCHYNDVLVDQPLVTIGVK